MCLFALQVKEAAEIGTKAGLSVMESGLLGSLSILCLCVGMLGVWIAYRTQNARVADQKLMSDRMESLVQKMSVLTQDLNKTFAGMEQAFQSTRESDQAKEHALQELAVTVRTLQVTLDSVVRDAVRAPYRSMRQASDPPQKRG
jgi:hypothetical protein